MALPSFEWLWITPSRRRMAIGAGVIGIFLFGVAVGRVTKRTPAAGGAPVAGATQMGGAAKAVAANGGNGPVPLSELSSGPCRTYAPDGWQITEKNLEGTIFNLQSGDRSQTAAYAGFAVSGGSASGAYGPQFRNPHSVALYVVGQVTGEDTEAVGEEEAVGPYQALKFRSAGHSGYVLIYRFPLEADPAGYGVILRMAIGKADDMQSVGEAGSVMAAIQCRSSLRPPPEGLYQVEARTSDHGAGSSGQGSDVTLAGTYNAQLNTGWAHDSAGRNYRVHVTEDWKSGPDGEGFYSPSGEKLQAGMQ